MKYRHLLWLVLIVVLLLGAPALAVAGLSVSRHTIAAGGGMVSSGAYAMHAAIGQAVTGVGHVGAYTICAGFWCHAGSYAIYLPLVFRN